MTKTFESLPNYVLSELASLKALIRGFYTNRLRFGTFVILIEKRLCLSRSGASARVNGLFEWQYDFA